MTDEIDDPKKSLALDEIRLENKQLLEAHNLVHNEINTFMEELRNFLTDLEETIQIVLEANESKCLDSKEEKAIVTEQIIYAVKTHPLFRNNTITD